MSELPASEDRERPHRIRIVEGTQRVRISHKGEVLAETDRPVALHEARLPVRYYIAPEDVRSELMTPTDTSTTCPFKGAAVYWSIDVAGDILPDAVWSYPDPIPEARQIAGLYCFYNEKFDIDVDGERQDRPSTPWS